jgi:hypothetical protein
MCDKRDKRQAKMSFPNIYLSEGGDLGCFLVSFYEAKSPGRLDVGGGRRGRGGGEGRGGEGRGGEEGFQKFLSFIFNLSSGLEYKGCFDHLDFP